jgi:hypothetical protein
VKNSQPRRKGGHIPSRGKAGVTGGRNRPHVLASAGPQVHRCSGNDTLFLFSVLHRSS